MKEIPVMLGSQINLPGRFHAAVAAMALTVHNEVSLRSIPGSRHWHVRKPGVAGTLEATWLPAERRFWFSVHDNRAGDWIETAIVSLSKELQTP